MSIKDGGPAFPCPEVSQNQATGEITIYQWSGSMTLRDYFAAKAMEMHGTALAEMESVSEAAWDEYIACRAYKTADAMLAAREKTNGQ
jgi:hypothetical protein